MPHANGHGKRQNRPPSPVTRKIEAKKSFASSFNNNMLAVTDSFTNPNANDPPANNLSFNNPIPAAGPITA